MAAGICVRTVKSVSDLRGKTIVLAQNSPSHYFALNALINGGVQPSEVNFKFTQDAFQAAAALGRIMNSGQDATAKDETETTVSDSLRLQLEDFLPHRLNVLSSLVSQALTRVYGQYGIGIPEWRILVTLGQFGVMTGKAIGARTHMHKTKVSRAVAQLERRKFLTRRANRSDLREVFLGDWEGGELRARAAAGDPLYLKMHEEQRWDVIPNGDGVLVAVDGEDRAVGGDAGAEQGPVSPDVGGAEEQVGVV